MGITHFPNGVSSFGVPMLGGAGLIPQTTGTYFFVDDAGSNANDGKDPDHPFADLDYAIGQTTANVGDIIIMMPGHAQTVTAQIACDKAGIQIIGLGHGRLKPTLTHDGTLADDLIAVSVANVAFKNFRIVGSAAACTALIDLEAGADDFIAQFMSFEQAETPLVGISVVAGCDRWVIADSLFLGTAAGPNTGIKIEGVTHDWVVERCDFNYLSATDLDEAGIASATTDTGIRVSDCRFIGMTLTAIDFDSSTTGLLERLSVLSLSSTVAELMDIGLCTAIDCKVGYQALSGATIPATTTNA